MHTNKPLRIIAICLLFLFVGFISMHVGVYDYDMRYFCSWDIHIFKNGLSRAYTVQNNYPPFFQYMLFLHGKIAGSEEAILRYALSIKIITLAFDFLGLWFVYKWIGDKTDFLLLLFINILNLGYSYNTVVWGQVDGIYSTMLFISMYYAYKNKMVMGTVWYVLAINMKIQAVAFFPVFGLMYLYQLAGKRNLRQFLYPVVALAITQALLLWPFLTITNGFTLFWTEAVASAHNFYPAVSMGSTNLWNFFLKAPNNIPDSTALIAGLSYMQVGLFLFCFSSFWALFPLLKAIYYRTTRKKEGAFITKDQLWLSCALVALSFYFFNTQMHERYSHPAMIFITAYSFFSRKALPYILFSLAYFLTLEKSVCWLGLNNYENFLFDGRLLASIFGVLIIYLFVQLYSKNTVTGEAV